MMPACASAVRIAKTLTSGEAAAGERHRIRHLRIGQPAPELVGEDIDGAPIRLSDFRGKVVVLSFWATSSAPYVRSIGGEKDLVGHAGASVRSGGSQRRRGRRIGPK